MQSGFHTLQRCQLRTVRPCGSVPAEQLGITLNHFTNQLTGFDLAQSKHLTQGMTGHMAVRFRHFNHHSKMHIEIFSRHHDVLTHADADPTQDQNDVYSKKIILFEFLNFIN